jgi:hypothetical protein
MDAIILNIMESWPLQLTVDTQEGPKQFTLDRQVTVRERGNIVDPGKLRPGQKIQIVISETIASIISIEIID